MFKPFTWYYFVNKNTKKIDKIYFYKEDSQGLHFRHGDNILRCSLSQAEGKWFESDQDPNLLAKAGKCLQYCYHGRFDGCLSSCPCDRFIHINSAEGQRKIEYRNNLYSRGPSTGAAVVYGD